MDQRLIQTMLDVDEHHWWYRGRRRIIRAELDKLPLPSGARILDAGCGSGRTLQELVDYGAVSGLELNPDAAEAARARGFDVQDGRLEELPWPDRSFELITCLDVIEHTPDDRRALRELMRVTTPGGWLLATVPAYQALWSYHDEVNHHYRRYERASLRSAVTDAGWQLQRMTSFNTLLFPPAAAVRLAQRRLKQGGDGQADANFDLHIGPPWLNGALERPLKLEASWLGRGRTLPAGLSLLAVVRKPAT